MRKVLFANVWTLKTNYQNRLRACTKYAKKRFRKKSLNDVLSPFKTRFWKRKITLFGITEIA